MGEDIRQILKKYWGYDEFRPLQEDIIKSVLDGRDTVGLMPTGGGKSITFQVPGMVLDGMTLVITPLISLMKDQVDNLHARHIKGAYFHAAMTSAEIRITWERIVNSRCKFLYISPERLRNDRFVEELRHLNINLIVVDEAHCISQWGYDFRPSYLNISKIRKAITGVPILALTATATSETVNDICTSLQLKNPNLLRKSFVRDNLSYIVRQRESKIDELIRILTRTKGSAIVYVRSRKRTKELADILEDHGVSATAFHAGLSFEDKELRQTEWKEGKIRVMVATNAFGMGIDKPDVRVVVHYDLPSSLEEYYQEAGRAGRDGKTSYSVVIASSRDKAVLKRRISVSFPPKDDVRKIYDLICTYLHISIGEGYARLYEFNIDNFCLTFKLSPEVCRSALKILSAAGWMDFIEESDTRSRVIISLNRDELYDVQGLSADAERVLTSLLRTYPGIFIEFVFISEQLISRNLGMDTSVVVGALIELSRNHVLTYVPSRRTPYIALPTSREELRYISIGLKAYEHRKSRMETRVNAMLDFVFNSKNCRVGRMLAYFNEENSCDCGKCDVCRSKANKSKNAQSLVQDMTNRLVNYLSYHSSGVSVSMIRNDFMPREKEALAALSFLCNEGYVSYDAISALYILTKDS
jgi:ATP-dependent DNA helicase RecQ